MTAKRVGAGVAVLRGQEVLLIRRRDNGLWDIPGGGKGRLEHPQRAARRELREETGLHVGRLRKLGVWPHQHTYPDGNVVDWTTHIFVADYVTGTPAAADDASEVGWWPLDALPTEISAVTGQYLVALVAKLTGPHTPMT